MGTWCISSLFRACHRQQQQQQLRRWYPQPGSRHNGMLQAPLPRTSWGTTSTTPEACVLLTPRVVLFKSSSRLPVLSFCSHSLLQRAEASTDNPLFPWHNPAFASVIIQMAIPGFQKNTNLRSCQLKKKKSGYFPSPTQISLKMKHYASTKSYYVTCSLQLF